MCTKVAYIPIYFHFKEAIIHISLYYSVKRSDVTVLNCNSEKTKLHKTLLPYFIVLASSMNILEIMAIEFHRIQSAGV